MLKRKKKKPVIRIIIALLLITGLATIGIRMGLAPTETREVTSFRWPEFKDVSKELAKGATEGRKQAVAVNEQIIYSNGTEVQSTASTIKMLTALMVMEKKPFKIGEEGETITITPEFYDKYVWYRNNNGSVSKVEIGEQISEYQALASMLMVSSNNMADSLAIWAFGSLDNYREKATQKLREWGLEGITVGVDASGYDPSSTGTAGALAKLGQKLIQNPVLAEIVGSKESSVPVVGKIENTNKLLGTAGVVGVKTGYIGEPSGYCLISAYKIGEKTVTVAELGAETREGSFQESQKMIETAQAVLADVVLAEKETEVGYYENWWSGKTPIRTEEEIRGLGWAGAEKSAKLDMTREEGKLEIELGGAKNTYPVKSEAVVWSPSLLDRFLWAIGLKQDAPAQN